MSELFKAWVSVNDQKEFEKRFPGLGSAMQAIATNPAAHANVFGAIVSGKPVDFNQIHTMDPNLTKVVASDLVHTTKEWSKDQAPTPQKINAYTNVFGKATQVLNAAHPSDLKVMHDIAMSPDVASFMSKLPTLERANALSPMLANIDSMVQRVGEVVVADVARFNDPATGVAARAGWRLSVQQNPMTGLLEVRTERSAAPTGTRAETAGGAVTGGNVGPFGGRESPALMGADASAARNHLTELVGRVNTMLETYTAGARLLTGDGKVNLRAVQGVAFDNITKGGKNPLDSGVAKMLGWDSEAKPAANVPKNDDGGSTPDMTRALQAVEAAEGTAGGNNTGVSRKGARGPHQLMPETAKEWGLKIDSQAGVDERTDYGKSAEAAGKELTRLWKTFKGNVEHVAAAYNAGMGNVTKALDKAERLGVPEQWRAFLPKPEETVPYIKRFVDAYSTQQIRR